MAAFEGYSGISTTASPTSGHVRRRTRSTSSHGLLALPHRATSLTGLGFNASTTVVERDDETSSSTSTASSSRRRESLEYSTYHSADTSVDYSESSKQLQYPTPSLGYTRDSQDGSMYDFDSTPRAAGSVQGTRQDYPVYLYKLRTNTQESASHDDVSPISPANSSSSVSFIESPSSPYIFPRRSTIGAPYWNLYASEKPTGLLSSPDIRVAVTPSPPQEYVASFGSTSARGQQRAVHRKEPSLSSACFPASSSYPSSLSSAAGARRPLSSKQAGKLRAQDPDQPDTRPRAVRASRQSANEYLFQAYMSSLGYLETISSYILPTLDSRNLSPSQKPYVTSDKRRKRSSSTNIQKGRRKRTLLLRLFWMAYICFSLLYLTAKLTGLSPLNRFRSKSSSVATYPLVTSLQPEAPFHPSRWQNAKHRVAGAYYAADAYVAARLKGIAKSAEAGGEFASERPGSSRAANKLALEKLPQIGRRKIDESDSSGPVSPLQSFTHKYRFSKLHSKLDGSLHDQIEPFLYRAAHPDLGGHVTACLYINDAWLPQLAQFVERWQGPVSVIYEAIDSKASARTDLVARLEHLREVNPSIRSLVDFHAVYTPHHCELQSNRSRERLITKPVGTNFHLNLARFFARTDMVWLVSDARILPSLGLRNKLNQDEELRKLVLDQAHAVAVPLFGATRARTPEGRLPLLSTIREDAGISQDGDGVAATDFSALAEAYLASHHTTLPVSTKDWPKTTQELKDSLIQQQGFAEDDIDDSERAFALYDRRWDQGKGPTSLSRWLRHHRQDTDLPADNQDGSASQPRKRSYYEVTEYDLHYSPSLVIGKDRQPWCTERFEYNRAVCTFQMYLQGAKVWVLPDEWAFTLESIDKVEKEKKNEADRLKSSISSRLHTKFHSEACMHYGRAFLSMGLWDTERAQHLRFSCGRVLSSYGIGLQTDSASKTAVKK